MSSSRNVDRPTTRSGRADEAFERSETEFGLAVEDFRAAPHHLDEEWTTSFRSSGQRLAGVVDALRAGSTELRDAVVQMMDGNETAAEQTVERARVAFRGNATVTAEVRALQPIIDEG